MSRKVVIYHGGCRDGFCAAWLFNHAFPDAEFVPAQYGDVPPVVVGADVVVADFSYPRAVLKGIVRVAASVVVLDHHKTAAADLDGFGDECVADGLKFPFVTFDMERSGGRLTWDWLQSNDQFPVDDPLRKADRPWLVDYTEDRDLWRWKLPDSREINAALWSYPLDFKVWDELSRLGLSDLESFFRDAGWAILQNNDRVIEDHVRNAVEVTIDGHKVLCVNATTLISEIAGELAKGRPFGATYFTDGLGRRVYSLRSREGGVDVAKVAAKFGGGGHAASAGFSTGYPYFDERL